MGRYRLSGGYSAESRLHHPQQRRGLRFYKQLRQHLESCASSKTLAFVVSLFTWESFSSDGTLITYFRDNPGRFSSLRLWRSDSHRKHLVCARSTIFNSSDPNDIPMKVLVLCSSKQSRYGPSSSLVQWRSTLILSADFLISNVPPAR